MSDLHRAKVMSSGRISQKLRTRTKLLQTAREFMARDEPVSVAAVAAEAGISTATAYRYFSDPETMKLEAVIALDIGETGDFADSFDELAGSETSVAKRAVMANRILVDFVRRNEPGYRLLIAKGHEQTASNAKPTATKSVRSSYRLPLIEQALDPVRRDLGNRFQDACLTLATVMGADTYFVLKDVCELDDAEIDRITEQTITSLVSTLTEPA